MFCPHCGASLPPEAAFCSACGKAVAAEKKSQTDETTVLSSPQPSADDTTVLSSSQQPAAETSLLSEVRQQTQQQSAQPQPTQQPVQQTYQQQAYQQQAYQQQAYQQQAYQTQQPNKQPAFEASNSATLMILTIVEFALWFINLFIVRFFVNGLNIAYRAYLVLNGLFSLIVPVVFIILSARSLKRGGGAKACVAMILGILLTVIFFITAIVNVARW